MIFVTVGTQLPFNRLVRAMDAWCAGPGAGQEVFGQIGQLGPDDYVPQSFDWAERIPPEAFADRAGAARVVVSHAGMGSIITALSVGTPIVILARRAHLGEHRNDHQFATMKTLGARPGIFPLEDAADLPAMLDRLAGHEGDCAAEIGQALPRYADDGLLHAVRDCIFGPGKAG